MRLWRMVKCGAKTTTENGEPDEARTRSLKTTLANLQSAYNGENEIRRAILDCLSLIRVTTVSFDTG